MFGTREDLKVSLEQRKVDKERRKALNLANKEKDRIRCVLYSLKERFKQVLLGNESLPEPLRFANDYFQFDERINRSLVDEAQAEMDKLRMKLAFEYEKSALGLAKVKTYFVDQIVTAKFEVKAIAYVLRSTQHCPFVYGVSPPVNARLVCPQQRLGRQNNIPQEMPQSVQDSAGRIHV